MARKTESKTNDNLEQVETEQVNRLGGVMRLLELERSFLIFAVIYFPIAWLFLNRGPIEEAILVLYTIVLGIVGVMMLVKFIVHLANAANDHSGRFGTLFTVYIFNALVPLVMFKVFGFVINAVLPIDRHQGLMCDLVRLFRNLYYHILQWQTSLSYIILGSLAAMFIFTLWSVRGRDNE
jgi:hypothetical protein